MWNVIISQNKILRHVTTLRFLVIVEQFLPGIQELHLPWIFPVFQHYPCVGDETRREPVLSVMREGAVLKLG